MKLIDKDAVLAEIERLREKLQDKVETNDFIAGEVFIMNYFLSFIVSLEVKEVDLNKEISNFLDNGMALQLDWTQCNIEVKPNGLRNFAKHFFELGLKAQKGK